MSGACLRICTAASCRSRGAETLRQECAEWLGSATPAIAVKPAITVKGVGCLGPCSEGPLLAVDAAAGGSRLFSLAANDAAGSEAAIEAVAADLQTALADGNGSALAHWSPPHSREIPADDPFLALQQRRVLAQCGRIDPAEIAEALAAGAYRQLQAVLQRNDSAAASRRLSSTATPSSVSRTGSPHSGQLAPWSTPRRLYPHPLQGKSLATPALAGRFKRRAGSGELEIGSSQEFDRDFQCEQRVLWRSIRRRPHVHRRPIHAPSNC